MNCFVSTLRTQSLPSTRPRRKQNHKGFDMFYLDISASTCCMKSVPWEVESVFKSHNVATDNLSLSKM